MPRIGSKVALNARRGTAKGGKGGPKAYFYLVSVAILLMTFIYFRVFIPQSPVSFSNEISKSLISNRDSSTITVAYAISLIKCADFQSSAETLSDAGIILRHSIHQNSVRNPKSGSKYDYKMYAIVHEDAESCSGALRDAGFELMVKPQPVKVEEIKGEHVRQNIEKAWCCGSAEFVKLYAYIIDAPLVVHLDMDKLITKPLDPLFDVMLNPTDEVARSKVYREFPNTPWPDRLDAVFTRDWHQAIPGRKAAYQAGFIVLKPDPTVITEVVDIIKEGDYNPGYGRDNGWGSQGYGQMVGSMAMQGTMAYFYDIKRPNTSVELNQCRYNHMGLDTKFNYDGRHQVKGARKGKCRNDQPECEQCLQTNVEDIYSIHYTLCFKPWMCVSKGSNEFGIGKTTIPEFRVDLKHCFALHRIWHEYRTDLEDQLVSLTGDKSVLEGRKGKFKKEIFMGHCDDERQYRALNGKKETMRRMLDLYK